MAERSSIEWTDASWSPWWGCTRVSPGCVHCYAESLSKRYGHQIWGPEAPRRFLSENHWKQPLRWNAQAAKAGRIMRVFPSMCDPLEDRRDLDAPRQRFFELVDATPNLMWLILTKRPENIWPLTKGLPPLASNLMFGVTIEDQQRLVERVPHIIECKRRYPGIEIFGSFEPLLSPVDFGGNPYYLKLFSWVICGGESGHGARPMHPNWARGLRDQCNAAGVPFFFKQWGEWGSIAQEGISGNERRECYVFRDGEGAKGIAFGTEMVRVGKKAAGRFLDGREWNELPKYWPANVGLIAKDELAVIA